MRHLAALAGVALVAACSSTPSRPPPARATDHLVSVRWEPVLEQGITGYTVTYQRAGETPTVAATLPDYPRVDLRVPSGAWTFRVAATSADRGEGEAAELQREIP